MNVIQLSLKKYQRKNNFWENKKKKAENENKKLEGKIESNKKIISKCWDKSPHWTDELVKPIVEEICKKLNLDCDELHDDRYVPMGLKAHVSVFFHRKRKTAKIVKNRDGTTSKTFEGKLLYSLTFVPKDLDKGEMDLETDVSRVEFKPNTLGDLNGFNIIDYPCPKTIDGIIDFMKNKKKYARKVKEN